jgi:hypothetical protein
MRREAELGRARNERDGSNAVSHLANRPDHFELYLRNTVAIVTDRQSFEDDVGCPAIAWRIARALLGLDQRVRSLTLGTVVDTNFHTVAVELSPIRPDASNACYFSLAERERGVGEIGVLRHLRPAALAALPLGGPALLETCCPDQRAADPGRAINARHRRPFLGCIWSRAGEPLPLEPARTVDQRAIEGGSGHRTGCGSKSDAHRAEEAAQKCPGGLQDYSCHALASLDLGLLRFRSAVLRGSPAKVCGKISTPQRARTSG